MAPIGNFRGRRFDGLADVARQMAELDVDVRGSALDQAEGADEAARHALPRHRKIIDGALGLRAPQRIGGHLQLAHAVVFNPETLAHCFNSARLSWMKGNLRLATGLIPWLAAHITILSSAAETQESN
jgi:hypothetical protein